MQPLQSATEEKCLHRNLQRQIETVLVQLISLQGPRFATTEVLQNRQSSIEPNLARLGELLYFRSTMQQVTLNPQKPGTSSAAF